MTTNNTFRASAGFSRRTALASLAGGTLALTGWQNLSPVHAAAGTDTLWGRNYETLIASSNESLWSRNRAFQLTMQSDGNLVVYGPSGPTWSSNTPGSGGSRAVMQADGNLVVYNTSGAPVFATGVQAVIPRSVRDVVRLVMQDDGNLVEYTNVAVWASASRSEQAIQWYYSRLGNRFYEGYCEKAVETAFGNYWRYGSARENWAARAKQYPYSSAPRGALVFYNTSSNGHVCISLGNGFVVSTAAGSKIGVVPISYFQNPLGWGWAP